MSTGLDFPLIWPVHIDNYDPDAPFLVWIESSKTRTLSYGDLLEKAQHVAEEYQSNSKRSPVELPLRERTVNNVILAASHLLARVPFSILKDQNGDQNGDQIRGERRVSQSLVTEAGATDDFVMITLETSGTTGTPKRIQLYASQIAHAVGMFPAELRTAPGEFWGHALPLHHVGGLSILARALSTGGGVAWAPDPTTDGINSLLHHVDVKGISLVSTQLHRLMEQKESPDRLSTLNAILLGGGPLPMDVAKHAMEKSYPVYQSYGMTESFAMISANLLSETPNDPQCVGKPFGDTQIMVDNGTIHLRGTQLGPAWKESWFDTGDIGTIDAHGRLVIEARRDDLILSGGNNISPAPIEDALMQHPKVEAAIVFGIENPEWGQQVVALVELNGSQADGFVTAQVLEQWLHDYGLTSYKIPKQWDILPPGETLPRTSLGKLARNEAKLRFRGG